MSVQELVMKT